VCPGRDVRQTLGVPRPVTKYVAVDGSQVAYQTIGVGPPDIVCVLSTWSNIDVIWDHPLFAAFLDKLSARSRLILFDRRGAGASDRLPNGLFPTWEQWADDIGAVMDAVGSERAGILAEGEGATMALLFSITRPDRIDAVVVANTSARMTVAPDYPIGITEETADLCVRILGRHWGTPELVRISSPTLGEDPASANWLAHMMRTAATPHAAAAQLRYIIDSIDIRHVLEMVQCPTLVLHNQNRLIPVEHGRYVAEQIDGARFIELPGSDSQLFWDPALLAHAIEFLTGSHPAIRANRILATVLFTDICGSTEHLATLGDTQWAAVLDAHDHTVRRALLKYSGTEINTTGDGFLATFDGPARAIRCAKAITEAASEIGLQLRAGLHTGECELRRGNVAGLTVHIAARIAALAGPAEVLVSGTVKDLVIGSGLEFEDRGEHELKGVPGSWKLFAVRDGA
jgi:class 3 adenylate cyclase/pimeloyl-ACP methyl ester carboxylesterase